MIGEWKDWAQRKALMEGMARKVGADLADLSGPEVQVALRKCLSCKHPVSCADWQDRVMDGTGQPPGYCRNRALLEELSKRG